MFENKNSNSLTQEEEINFKSIIKYLKDLYFFFRKQWIILVFAALIGSTVGFFYAFYQKPIYTATLSFALEEDKGSGGGLSGALGLASSLGIDLGTSAGGAFSGGNLIELIKSRRIIERALLNPLTINGKVLSLADYFIKINNINQGWSDRLMGITFPPFANREKFTFLQDSLLGTVFRFFEGDGSLLSVSQKDKKISILIIEVHSTDEKFAKVFTEAIAKEVSEFYITTKSRKAKTNVDILQKQVDSIRNELNSAITGVAIANDNTFNLNSAFNIKKAPTAKRQVDVQANTAILTQLVTNLEISKLTLLKETPLIQIIDRPILPLMKTKVSKSRSLVIGGMLSILLVMVALFSKRSFQNLDERKLNNI